MNDPYFSSREMLDNSEQAESIYNEFVARIHSAFGSVISRTIAAPPGTPNSFDAYLVPAGATGDWAGLDHQIVIFLDDWLPMPVRAGMRIHIAEENKIVEFTANGGEIGAATNGSQTLVQNVGNGRIENWDVLLGTIATVTLLQNAVLMPPINMLAGRRYILRVIQDAVGGWDLDSVVTEFATVGGGTTIFISTVALDVSDVLIQGPSAPFNKPAIYEPVNKLKVTAP